MKKRFIYILLALVPMFAIMTACSDKEKKELEPPTVVPEQPAEPEDPEDPEEPQDPEQPQEPDVPLPEHDGYAIFVLNKTSWTAENVRLYMWGDRNDLNGGWPGMSVTGKQIISGVEYLYFDFGKANTGLSENLIFSNNGSGQLDDFPFTISRDVYVEISATGVMEITPGATDDDPVAVKNASNDIIYEVNPRFYGASNCLKGVNNNLDRISKTGATVLWLMPINEFGREKSVGSPYCIRDYKAIDSKMGTVADLRTLVNNAHNRGMKVILDWVANHTAWDNAWVKDHPDWFVRDAAGKIQSPNGWTDVAELDFSNKDMRAAMIDAMVYWIDECDIDGYRCDHVDGVPTDFWSQAITAIRASKPSALMLAESSDRKFLACGFDILYGWRFGSYLTALFTGKSSPEKFIQQSANEMTSLPDGADIMRYSLNHDTANDNTLTEIYGNNYALMAATVLATMMDGTPMFYDGNLINYSGKLNFFNYSNQTFDTSLTDRLATLADAYHATAEARCGHLKSHNGGKAVVFSRSVGSKSVLVLVNTSSSTISVDIPAPFASSSMTDAFSSSTAPLPSAVTLSAYGYKVYYN